jgi:hypothetical protein
MRRICRALWGAVALAGCTFDAAGKGSGGDETEAATDATSDSASASVTDSASTTGPGTDAGTDSTTSDPGTSTTEPTGSTTTTDPSETTGPDGEAVLEISDGPTFDFGEVTLGEALPHTFTVSNTGEAPATAISATLGGAFSFPMGGFPGEGGDCGEVLDAGDACTVVVAFDPAIFGPVTETFELEYDGAQGGDVASIDVTGTGIGTTRNLVVNPGGEDPGAPPPGWTQASGFNWATTTQFSRTGSRSMFPAGIAGAITPPTLVQALDVSAFEDSIDASAVEVDFSAYARTFDTDNDDYTIALRMLDGSGDLIGSPLGLDADSGVDWELLELDAVLAPQTRTVEIGLVCVYSVGQDCNAYFDDVSATLTYAP